MRLGLALLVVSLAMLVPRPTRAQDKPTLSGSWSATALTEKWAIGDWGEACGPKPKPQGAGGGSVQVREQGGELSMIGAGRAFNTAECWEQMPGLARSSHSASGGGRFWRTRCNTAKNDPRQATVVTTISATDTSITLHETGQYQFVIQDQNCTASVARSRSYSLVKRDGDTAPTPSASASAAPEATATASAAPAPPPPSKPAPKSCTGEAGEPARLEVSPSKKLLRPGEKFSFRAVVLDLEGCPVSTRPTWTVAPGPLASKASIDPTGSLRIAEDAGEGKLELVAAIAGKGVTIHVEVASADHYDALLAASGLNDAGEAEDVAVAVIATGTIGGRAAVAEDSARGRKNLFLVIVSSLAVGLAFVGLVLWRRGRRRATASLLPAGATLDRSSLAPLSEDQGGQPAAAGPVRPKKGKICPTCGGRFSGDDQFCGKDGTALVMIN